MSKLWYIDRWQPIEKIWLPYAVFDDAYKCLRVYERLAEMLCAEEFRICEVSHEND